MKKLEDTRKIINGSVVRVYYRGFGYSMLTVYDSSDAYLAVTAEDDLFNAIREGDYVEAYLWVEDVASYEFTLRCIGRIAHGPRILFFEHTRQITRSEERKCLAAEVDLPIRFFGVEPSRGDRGITTEEIVMHNGTIRLITDREATMTTAADIGESRFLKGTVDIGGEPLELLGIIEAVDGRENTYMITFSGISDRTRNRIQDYIFMNYREGGYT